MLDRRAFLKYCLILFASSLVALELNSLRPRDAYMHTLTDHHWLDNGLSPGRRQAITWNNDGILLYSTLGNKLNCYRTRNSYIFIQESEFEIVVWKMADILSRPQCVNMQIE